MRPLDNNWIETNTGAVARLWALKPIDSVRIHDIAHALSNLCRFNGHTRRFYSVAQHSMLVSQNLPAPLQLAGLLHDAAEAYIGDMVQPIKCKIGKAYHAMEHRVMREIMHQLGLERVLAKLDDPLIKHADLRALATERRDLFPRRDKRLVWQIDKLKVRPFKPAILPLAPDGAKALFLHEYFRLLSYYRLDRQDSSEEM